MIVKNGFLKLLLLVALLQILFTANLKSQNRRFAKRIIKHLCSEKLVGRGYSNGGDSKAAAFIIDKLKHYKAKPFANSYKQEFAIRVNTFPNKMCVKINDKELIPQYDYLVSARSNSIHGKFPVITLDAETLDNREKFDKIDFQNLKNSFVLIDTTNMENQLLTSAYKNTVDYNLLNAKGIITVAYKGLTHVPSQVAMDFAAVTIKKEAIPEHFDSIYLDVDNEYFDKYLTNNIAAYIQGETDSFIVFSSHYDHLGEMGKNIYFPGANDNASGTAMLLDMIRHYSKTKEKPKYSIAFLFFSGEELGLLGSFYYVEHPLFPLQKIKCLINLDMVGSGDKGIKVVNGTKFRHEFDKLVELNRKNNYLPIVSIRGPAANSDHYPFYEKGVKSFFIYTLGEYKEYHSIHDNAKNLPLSEYKALFKLLTEFVDAVSE